MNPVFLHNPRISPWIRRSPAKPGTGQVSTVQMPSLRRAAPGRAEQVLAATQQMPPEPPLPQGSWTEIRLGLRSESKHFREELVTQNDRAQL